MNYLVILQLSNLGCRARAGGSVTANPDSPIPSSPSAPEVQAVPPQSYATPSAPVPCSPDSSVFHYDIGRIASGDPELISMMPDAVYSLCVHGLYVELCWLMQAATQVMVHVIGTM